MVCNTLLIIWGVQHCVDHLGCASQILRVFFQAVCVLGHYSDAIDRIVWKTLHKSGAEFCTIIPNILTIAELRHYQNITLWQPGIKHTYILLARIK